MTPITVIVLAKNEGRFIERCLRSVSWADEFVVLDSGSTDDTRGIAASLGARVHEQEWLGWPLQRNAAIALSSNDWVLYLECDEIVTPELARSIMKAMSSDPDPRDGYAVDRRGDFLGLLLPNVSRPAKIKSFVRIFNRTHGAFDSTTKLHEEVIVPGASHVLTGVLLHWRGYVMDEYVPAFNRYATVEAEMLDDKGVKATAGMIFFRPILRFLWTYVIKREYRLGARGLIHAMLKATSEYIRYAKLWEMQNARPAIHPPLDIYDPARVPAETGPSEQAERVSELPA